ncbi:MAG: AMP-binding protein [bacterium]|nr:AMP-binding protein [bacterium]
MFIENLPEEKAYDCPSKAAFKNSDTGEETSYLEFFKMSSFLADFLFRQNSINRSDIVISDSDDELFNSALFFACASTGAVFFSRGNASREECLSMKSKASFGKGWIFPASFNELGYKEGAAPVSEVETYEHDPAIMIREEKGIFGIIPYSMLVCDSLSSMIRKKISSDDMSFSSLDFSKEDSFSSCFLPCLIAGGTVCTGKSPEKEKITIASGDYGFWKAKSVPLDPESTKHSEFIIRNADDISKAPEAKCIKPSYALKRAGLNAFRGTELTCDGIRLGIPGYNMKAKIAGSNLEDAPEGRNGRLVMRGRNLFSGFYRNPAATSECLKKGWTDTGILACRKNGFFEITC